VQLTDFIESEFLGEQVMWCCNLRELFLLSLLEKLLSDFDQDLLDILKFYVGQRKLITKPDILFYLGRWKLLKKSLSTLLSSEELAKDMVKNYCSAAGNFFEYVIPKCFLSSKNNHISKKKNSKCFVFFDVDFQVCGTLIKCCSMRRE